MLLNLWLCPHCYWTLLLESFQNLNFVFHIQNVLNGSKYLIRFVDIFFSKESTKVALKIELRNSNSNREWTLPLVGLSLIQFLFIGLLLSVKNGVEASQKFASTLSMHISRVNPFKLHFVWEGTTLSLKFVNFEIKGWGGSLLI